MDKLPIKEITRTIAKTKAYCFRVELNSHIVIDVQIDLKSGRQYALLGFTDRFPVAEVFWEQESGYGRSLNSWQWHRIEGQPFANYLGMAVDSLKQLGEDSISVEEHMLVAHIRPERLPLRDEPETFFYETLGFRDRPVVRDWVERMIELSREVEVWGEVRISRENSWIQGVTLHAKVGDSVSEMFVALRPGPLEIPALPDEALRPVEPSLPMMMLLIQLPKWGWSEKLSHGPWAQRALDLILETDRDEGKYAEIYHWIWAKERFTDVVAKSKPGGAFPNHNLHHPIVLGAVFEDSADILKDAYDQITKSNPYEEWFASDPNYKLNTYYYFWPLYFRDYHHFGGEDTGLQHKWYFAFRGDEIPTRPGNRYYSACEWGYAPLDVPWFRYGQREYSDLPKTRSQFTNHLTFTDAIRQYNSYTFDGKRLAYLMLGHVVHLLQDVGQPDHARLVDHAGSGRSDWEFKQWLCPLIALEAASLGCLASGPFYPCCFIAVFNVIFGPCMANANWNEVGYEKLIADMWDLSQAEDGILETGILKRSRYDHFFLELSTFAINSTAMKSALGCGDFVVPIPVPPWVLVFPNANPEIDATNTSGTKPYIELTNKLVPRIVGYTAGLIQFFYNIVNYPPIVQRVKIIQWQAGDRPQEFGVLARNRQDHCERYDAEWVDSHQGRSLKMVIPKQPLAPTRTAYVFVQFGPADVGPLKGGRQMREAGLRLIGTNLMTGDPFDEPIRLEEDFDPTCGYYYWGSFLPNNCVKDPWTLDLEITGRDAGAHYTGRQASGDELDAEPATKAYVDANTVPTYPWKDYKPGADKNHTITIAPLKWYGLEVTPTSLTVLRRASVSLRVKQKTWDCRWEERFGPVSCPVTWKIETKLWKVRLVGDNLPPGEARLEIEPDRRRCPPGNYTIEVTCSLGPYSQTVVISVDVL